MLSKVSQDFLERQRTSAQCDEAIAWLDTIAAKINDVPNAERYLEAQELRAALLARGAALLTVERGREWARKELETHILPANHNEPTHARNDDGISYSCYMGGTCEVFARGEWVGHVGRGQDDRKWWAGGFGAAADATSGQKFRTRDAAALALRDAFFTHYPNGRGGA